MFNYPSPPTGLLNEVICDIVSMENELFILDRSIFHRYSEINPKYIGNITSVFCSGAPDHIELLV